ncbi:MAG: WYL domain-containing protein [Syntrophaceae bacterium]|nr:WYL domain-containing protein [Syntrophaceae bacterium]
MGKKLAFERYNWFHGQIKANRYPNARKLAEKFEISEKHAQREIEFMRERLYAPLLYDPGRRGYRYEDDSYELPPVWFKEDELLALCLSLRLSSTLPDRKLKTALYQLLEKFLTFRFLDLSPSLRDIKEKVSVKNVEYYKVDEAIFHKVVDSLFRNEGLKISYYTPHKDEITERVIQPLHLLCYMGSWHLIAFCTLKGDLRDFALSRIRTIEAGSKRIGLPKGLGSVKEYINKNFGLMSGDESIEVCLRFGPEVSPWISEQIWFSGQEISRNEDGSICLKFPVADFREVRREILRYGANVEVLSPPELREEIKQEIARMSKVYA